MKWSELKSGDVVARTRAPEVCLLLKRDGASYTWLVLDGWSHEVMGSNPYTVDDTDDNLEIEGWDVYRAGQHEVG